MDGEREASLCGRCGRQFSEGMLVDGRTVCVSCAEVIFAEKAAGYRHGPGFGRLSARCCARCGVDLLSLEAEHIVRLDGKEYCDICIEELQRQRQRRQTALEDIYECLSEQFPDICLSAYDDGYALDIPENNGRKRLSIFLGEELTLSFADWHEHYSFTGQPYRLSLEDFYACLSGLLNNELAAVCAYDISGPAPRWCGSSIIRAEDANEKYLRGEFGGGRLIVCSFWDPALNRELELREDYGEAEKKTVRAGLPAVKAVLLGSDTEAKKRLLYCLDWFMAPCYEQDISAIKQPLLELLQTMIIMPNEEGVIDIVLLLLTTYGEPPFKILEEHFGIIPEIYKPGVLRLLERER